MKDLAFLPVVPSSIAALLLSSAASAVHIHIEFTGTVTTANDAYSNVFQSPIAVGDLVTGTFDINTEAPGTTDHSYDDAHSYNIAYFGNQFISSTFTINGFTYVTTPRGAADSFEEFYVSLYALEPPPYEYPYAIAQVRAYERTNDGLGWGGPMSSLFGENYTTDPYPHWPDLTSVLPLIMTAFSYVDSYYTYEENGQIRYRTGAQIFGTINSLNVVVTDTPVVPVPPSIILFGTSIVGLAGVRRIKHP